MKIKKANIDTMSINISLLLCAVSKACIQFIVIGYSKTLHQRI